MRLSCYVVLGPEGTVVSTPVISRFHDTKKQAIDSACTMARYLLESELQKDVKRRFPGALVAVELDPVPWARARQMGFRVRKVNMDMKVAG